MSVGSWQADEAIFSVSSDGIVTVGLAVTTRAVAADGTRVELVTVDPMPDPPAPSPKEALLIALELGPDGANFDPPLLLSINYGKLSLPPGADVANAKLYVLADGKWRQVADFVRDPKNSTISTTLAHFSEYAVIVPMKSDFNWLPYGLGGGAGTLVLASLFVAAYYRRWSVAVFAAESGLQAGNSPQPIRLQCRDSKRRPFKPGANVSVRLTASSPTGRFDMKPDGAFENSSTTVLIPRSTGELTVYYKDPAPRASVLETSPQYRIRKWVWSRWPAKSKLRVELQPRD